MRFVLIFGLLLLMSSSNGQNGLIGAGFGTNDWSTTDNFGSSAGSTRILTTTANGTGNQYFRLVTNWSGNYNQWGPSSVMNDYQVSTGTEVSSSEIIENSSTKAYYINVGNVSYNYVFKTKEGGNPPSSVGLIVFEVQGTIITCSSVARNYTAVSASLSPTVTATLSGSLATGHGVYIRYTTDNYSTSTIAAMSGSGTSYTYDIPTQTAGTTVSYYIFTSGSGLTISHANADFYTINLENNSGSNYSYTVSTDQYRSNAATGNWSTAATWQVGNGTDWITATSAPTSAAGAITIQNGHNITIDADVTARSLDIESGGTLTASDGSARSLSLVNSSSGTTTTLNNSGTWSNGTGGSTVIFTGAPSSGDAIHQITGTIVFENLTVNKTSGTDNVGASFQTGCSLTGTLEIGSGGYISTAPPTSFYAGTAILKFNQGSGAVYDVNTNDYSWSFSQVPQNLTISSGTVNLNADRIASGNLIIDGGTLVLNSNTPKLTIQGNWTRTSGTFTKGTGTVIFSGSGASIISTNTTSDIYSLEIDKSGGASVTMSSDVTVSNSINLKAGTLDLGSNTLEIGGTLTQTSGVIDADAGTISFTNTSAISLSSTTFSGSIANLTLNGTGGVSLGTSSTVTGVLTLTSGILSLGANTLTLNGTISGTSTLAANGTSSNLSIGGSGALGTIYMDQTSSGTSNRLNNLTYNRSTSGTLSLGSEMQSIGIVTHTDGTLETNNNLKLVATGSTTYGQIAGTGTGSITETVSMQMIIPGSSGGWRNFSVPFDTITPGQLGNQIKLAMSNGTSINGNSYDQNLFSWAENGATWTAISNSASNLYGSGLNLYVFDPSTTTVTLAGNYSSSTKNYGSLTNSASGTASNDGWHLLANPFPSGIDWNATTKQTGMSGDYAVYSVANGTYRPWNGTTGSAGQYIPPMHAFWVKVNATLSSDFEISTGNRVTNTVNHFQKGNTLANNIVVDVKSPFNTYKDQVILYSEPQLDPMHRTNAQKLLGLNEAPNIWVVFNANKQSILPLAETELDEVFPLGFKCALDGTYTLNFSVENLGPEQEAWLEDRQKNTWHNMEKGDYSFVHKASDPNEGRFFIHYKNEMTSIKETTRNSVNYWVGQNENALIVSVDESITLVLYDLSGRKLLQQKLESGLHAIPATKWNGFILVELAGETGTKTFKVIR